MQQFKRQGVIIVVMICGLIGSLSGGGTKADYERSAKVRSRTRDKVYGISIKPHWFDDNTKMWYRLATGLDAYEYVWVDLEKGNRQTVFDHDRLAKALTAAGVDNIASQKLPIDKLEFLDDGATLLFHLRGKIWHCDLKTYELTDKGDVPEESLPNLLGPNAPKVSDGGYRQVTLMMENRLDVEVEMFWLDTSGERVSYGTLEPGERRRRSTRSGHVWLIANPDRRPVGIYRAGNEDAKVLIGVKNSINGNSDRRRPGRGGRRGSTRDSSDGQWTTRIKDYNLYLHDRQTQKEYALTTDGTADNYYTDQIYFSPDSSKLVVIRCNKGEGHKVHFVESSPKDQVQPKLHTIDYYKPGDVIDIERPYLFDVQTQEPIPVDNVLFDNPYFLRDFRWRPDSSELTFVYNQRGHQVLRVVGIDAATGSVRSIVNETSETFICYSSKFFCEFIDQANELIWMSERNGWNHLYLVDIKTGAVKNPITTGEWVVRDVKYVDQDARQITFTAGGIVPGQDPYYLQWCRINFDGTGLTMLTEGDGTHSVQFSPDRKYLVDTWSRVNLPPVHTLRRVTDGKKVCDLGKADASALLATGWKMPEPFVAKGRDGRTDIYGVIYRPSNFDPAVSYPVIERIYAGPHSNHVPKSFSSQYSLLELAELGFVLVQIDGMGTSNRSKAFHDVCWKNLADAGLPDRIAWMKAAARKYPYMDITRVGIYGGSAGGQNAAGAVMTHGDFYKAAVADCGCHDNRMDKIWWNEQWMGWPVGPEYAANSNVTLAKNLTGKLFLMVGEMDTNVDPASTMQVVNALIKANKDFDLLVVPGGGHCAGSSGYGWRRQKDFFVRNLLGVEPRSN